MAGVGVGGDSVVVRLLRGLVRVQGNCGTSESLKIDSGEGWEGYDTHPRYPYDKRNSNDEMSIMLKSVKTF